MEAIAEHSIVELSEDVHGWAAGTLGAVVSDCGDVMLVEVSDDKGVALATSFRCRSPSSYSSAEAV